VKRRDAGHRPLAAQGGRSAEARSGVPDYRFDHLLGLDACDAFTLALAEISGQPVPASIERQRAQLQDAMVDTHFMTGFLRVGSPPTPTCCWRWASFSPASVLKSSPRWRRHASEVLAENAGSLGAHRRPRGPGARGTGAARPAHRRQLARRAQRRTPAGALLRAGFPQYDWVGGYARTWVGYRGARQALFDIANLFLGNHHDTLSIDPSTGSAARATRHAGAVWRWPGPPLARRRACSGSPSPATTAAR
jgi:nitrogenase molybdenum-iron protein NifN